MALDAGQQPALWALALFVFTCSLNFHLLIQQHVLNFRFNSSPDWSELLNLDFQWYSGEWISRKIGHFFGFFTLALLASSFGKIKSAFYWCVIYAAFTEILQLFFFRGGRIYDVINDALGILLAYFLCTIQFRRNSRITRCFKNNIR